MRGDKPCLECCDSVSFWIAINAVGKTVVEKCKASDWKIKITLPQWKSFSSYHVVFFIKIITSFRAQGGSGGK